MGRGGGVGEGGRGEGRGWGTLTFLATISTKSPTLATVSFTTTLCTCIYIIHDCTSWRHQLCWFAGHSHAGPSLNTQEVTVFSLILYVYTKVIPSYKHYYIHERSKG